MKIINLEVIGKWNKSYAPVFLQANCNNMGCDDACDGCADSCGFDGYNAPIKLFLFHNT